ncbi:erythromycin esterase [Halovenus aranensis]|uniref:Erythromycin esterase n=1 Tax=Halovenus aranensis TaxID=890420 RepID=A0A1G8V7D6_9EURY|nr:erythromycin esterase family protein [Halovenus aranensis]SDJ61757.1 erythromycin esterase [Halovenus aranensis]
MIDDSASETSGTATELTDAEATALTDYTTQLQRIDPLAAFEDSRPWSTTAADGSIIALGEATHGTREFFRLKHRVLRRLVETQGVRVFAMEATFAETLAINDYVVYGEGDPREAIENIYFWTWNVEAVLSMVEWLRSFNEGRPLEDRVRFFGFDAQYTSGAVSRLDAFLDRAEIPVPETLRADLAAVDDDGERPDGNIQPRLDTAPRLVEALNNHFDDHRKAYITATDERAYALSRRSLTTIEQATAYQRALHRYDGEFEGDLSDDELDAVEEILQVRDRAMADNVEWLLEFTDTDTIVLWAHDAHINRQKHTIRGTDAVADPMGKLLADRHGDAYVAVGFSFGSGSFQAITPGEGLQRQTLQSPVPGTIDATLASRDVGSFLLDVREAKRDDRLDALLNEPQQHFSTGATYDETAPREYLTEYVYGEAFDALCFVDETTRALPVETDD